MAQWQYLFVDPNCLCWCSWDDEVKCVCLWRVTASKQLMVPSQWPPLTCRSWHSAWHWPSTSKTWHDMTWHDAIQWGSSNATVNETIFSKLITTPECIINHWGFRNTAQHITNHTINRGFSNQVCSYRMIATRVVKQANSINENPQINQWIEGLAVHSEGSCLIRAKMASSANQTKNPTFGHSAVQHEPTN